MSPANNFFAHPLALVESSDIGEGTRVWAWAHVMAGARVGAHCNIGEHCFVEGGAILGNNVTVGGSGYSEFAQYIESGKMRAIAVTSAQRLKGINVPTLKEQGIDVEIGNWRGVYGAPGITAEQRKALTDMILKAVKSKAWAEAMEKNAWTPALMTGKEFDDFVDREFASLRATMVKAGMV